MPSRAESPARTVALTAGLLALAAALGYAEAVALPPLPVPGVRLGLANIAVVIALASLGPRPALTVAIGRVLVVGLATASLGGPAGLMALAGAVASWAVMSSLRLAGPAFSPVGWSVAGAASHVAAQLAVAVVLVGSAAPLYLAPVALALSLAAGLSTGVLAGIVLKRSPMLLSRPLTRHAASGTGEAIRSAP